ncbi:MAG: nucleotide exchange factor GrpE [Armatimonadota bacterium]
MKKDDLNKENLTETEASDEMEIIMPNIEDSDECEIEIVGQCDSDEEDIVSTEEVENLRAEIEKLKGDYLRSLADFDNFRKRQREEVNRRISSVKEEIFLQLLPIIDNFERAIASADAEHDYDAVMQGVDLTLRQLKELLEKNSIEKIDAIGCEFDPEVHEAVAKTPSEEYKENIIIDEIEKGYKMDSKVLRPSRVVVVKNEE